MTTTHTPLPMKANPRAFIFSSLLVMWTAVALSAATLTVRTDQPGPRVTPYMWGIFFEDINLGADGGLYAELVKNRSFEFKQPMMGWQVLGDGADKTCEIRTEDPANQNQPHYLRVRLPVGAPRVGLANEGFRGMGVREGEKYVFTVQGRSISGTPPHLRVELVSASGKILDEAVVSGFASEWDRQKSVLRASATDPKARLNVWAEGPGQLDLDMISLFSVKTWRNRPGGLRADLVQMLADLKPGFMRFPGGCIVEGRYLTNRYQWKNTIGTPAERHVIINRWNDEFKHRPAPDYFQSFGLGFYEYFLLCEDIGAEPLPILNCGMACQFNSGELVSLGELDPYIQDALDLIEFANGPVTSAWGRKRAEMGHPKPFNMKLLGVGNEQWGPQYIERYEQFAKVLKARHPEIRLISSAGPDPNGEKFDFLWPRLRALNADIVDEHFYRPPEWFFENVGRYDKYDRNGPKVFAGEYAAQSVRTVSPENRNNLLCALGEAAMMTGFERNADVVQMASYAPLFGHVDGWQWTPNLIWCDNLRVVGTPNYYVQQLFSRNRGDTVLPVALNQGNGKPTLFASATREDKSDEVILKVVNRAAEPAAVKIQLAGARKTKGVSATVLSGCALTDENTLDQPSKIAPVRAKLDVSAAEFEHVFAPYSLTVLRLKTKS